MHDNVKDYYGKVLSQSSDLQTNACSLDTQIPTHIKTSLSKLHDEVLTRYYGCGLVYPQDIEGRKILDLGCGAGRDVYLLSQLVGEQGHVTGVDMTLEQLQVARRHQDYHTEAFGYQVSNVTFLQGYIEKLLDLDLAPASFDAIVSNCVINLSPDKQAVLKGAFELLKEGGELYFSDVYADRRIPQHLVEDPLLYGECLSGALYWNDFISLAKQAGFGDPRLVTSHPITIENQEIEDKLGHIKFYSATYRLFKLPELESACEDYGQAVIYKGSIAQHPQAFELDNHHVIEKGQVFPVCGNTWRMLEQTRFKQHFEFIGNWDTHFGIFPGCGTDIPFADEVSTNTGGCC